MNVAPDREAETQYLTGTMRELFEAAVTRANGDTRTALALLQGCFVEMAIRLVQDEVVSARHGAALSAFLQMGGDRLKELGAAYGRGRLAASPQNEGAHLAQTLRGRFETSSATRTPHASDSWDDDE